MAVLELKDRRNKLLVEMQGIALAGFSAESRAKFDTINKGVEVLEADIAREERVASIAAAQNSFTRSPRGGIGQDADVPEERKKAFSKAFRSYARHGWGAMEPEHRALLTTSDATGGALVPQMFDSVLHEALKFYGPTASLVRQKVTSNGGAPIKVALVDDTENSLTLLTTEGTSSPAETDASFQSKLVGVDTVSGGLVLVSVQELEDSAFDLDTWLRSAFGKRYARGLEAAVTGGKDGAGTALPNQASGGLAGSAVVGTTTASLAAGIGWDDLTTAFGALDPAYINPNTKWVMNSNTRSYLIGLKDGFGRPYFIPDPSADGPFQKLLGYEVVLNQGMPNMGANALPILFGDLESAYVLRTEGQPSIVRLNERYMDSLNVGFFMYARIGGTTLVKSSAPNPLVSLKQAAS